MADGIKETNEIFSQLSKYATIGAFFLNIIIILIGIIWRNTIKNLEGFLNRIAKEITIEKEEREKNIKEEKEEREKSINLIYKSISELDNNIKFDLKELKEDFSNGIREERKFRNEVLMKHEKYISDLQLKINLLERLDERLKGVVNAVNNMIKKKNK